MIRYRRMMGATIGMGFFPKDYRQNYGDYYSASGGYHPMGATMSIDSVIGTRVVERVVEKVVERKPKYSCEYCTRNVESDSKGSCPFCGAPLTKVIE